MYLKKLLLFLFVSLVYSCSNVNILDSDDLHNSKDRIDTLKKYITAKSDIKDADFKLFNVNGFGSEQRISVPGSSSWDYKFVVKVQKEKVDNWTSGMVKTKSKSDLEWMEDVIENRKTVWVSNSKPEYYTRKGEDVTLILYREEGIVFKRIINT